MDRPIAAPDNDQEQEGRKEAQPQPHQKQEQSRWEEERPKDGWSEYNRGRRAEGQRYVRWMRRIADIAREILGIAPGTRDRRVSAILVSILKSEENLSYWGLIKHFDRHPGDLELCELSRPYCRSWYQLRISETDPAVLQRVIAKMAGCDAVHDTLLVDSSGFSIARYVDWQNAKYGKLSVRLFAKLHIMHTLHGMVCAATVTAGNASDSPYLRLMVETLPEGDGDVLADAAYGGIKNCNAIRDSGRRAIIDSKSNAIIKGFNARAAMLRFREAHPGTFYQMLRLRNNIESVFSSMKALFGGVVRAFKPHTQAVELLSMTICYNMAFA